MIRTLFKNMNRKFISILVLTLLSFSSCHVGRFFWWNFADINDDEKFKNVKVNSSETKFVFQQNTVNTKLNLPKIKLEDKTFDFEQGIEKDKTLAFLILRNDTLLYEKYFENYNQNEIHPSFSVAKSFVSALVGIAIDEGFINSVDDPITKYLPELIPNKFENITIKHLLEMRSGIQYNESYFNPFGDVAKYYYGRNLNKYLLKLKADKEPNKKWEYKSINTQLLGKIVENATKKPLNQYLQEKIWLPLGMEYDATWSVDSKNNATVKAFCCLNACARDFAKFGLLYLNNGKWNGKQLISEQWIKQTSEFDEPLNYFMYKNHFWHNPKMEIISDSTIYPKMYRKGFDYFNGEKKDIIAYPTGNYRAEGILGQFIFICPEKNMVIVRLGTNYGKTDWVNLFEKIAQLN